MKTLEIKEIKGISISKANCSVDLGDGSERGEYVSQDYILKTLGRPHRGINLMYCYYPLDKGFPGRVSEIYHSNDKTNAWGYPYDDYFTYKGGIGGDLQDEPFKYMREVRSHFQDVVLTLTIDPHVSDLHLKKIAEDLRTFGRMELRINHEATGSWFSFNKRCTYQEVADFYVRFHNIIKEVAPNVKTILCIGGVESMTETEITMEKEFTEAVKCTDIWSVDKYMALHWGYPNDVAVKGGNSHSRSKVEDIYNLTKRSYERYKTICGGTLKPMVMSEFNADGDVTGPFDQAAMIKAFCDIIKNEPATWFTGFTFYQFRDRGRLGLEIEDVNNKDVGIPTPSLDTYKEIISDPYFCPKIAETGNISLPVTLRYGSSDDATGIALPLTFQENPVFCELYFEESLNLMLEINGRWFYKSPKASFIDLMPAFYEKPLNGSVTLQLNIFAPPGSGENDPTQGIDWQTNYYTTVSKLPKIRIEYEPVM